MINTIINKNGKVSYVKVKSNYSEEEKVEYYLNQIKILKTNPSDEIKLESVKRDGRLLQYIKKPTEEMGLIAVTENWLAIECIDYPTEEMIEIVLKTSVGTNRENKTIYLENITLYL